VPRASEEAFDAVVVGSGFGGSVMTYRLAQAKLDVCLLERGKKWPPGSFPRTPFEFSRATWDPSEGAHGLYDVWSFRGLSAMIASGLGGGSLIYANVLLRRDERWFHDGPMREAWPIDYADLERHYDNVEKVLTPNVYPQHLRDITPKARAFAAAVERQGLQAAELPLAVTFPGEGEELGRPFGDPEQNIHRAQRYTCRLVGECDVGCNFGSKNTLDYTYLSAAEQLGAEIKCRHEVKAFTPVAGGYRVEVVDHTDAEEGVPRWAPAPRRTIFAKRLILCAGSLGSPYLLMRNRGAFPAISPRLGTHFCGNGDFLTFAARCAVPVEPARGPVITSGVRVFDARHADPRNDRPGHYVQDGGYPASFAWIAELLAAPRILRADLRILIKLAWGWLTGRPERNLSHELSELFGGGRLSAGSLPLLGMGREPPQGRMRIVSDGKLDIKWSFRLARPYFEQVRRTMAALADGLEGSFEDNVLWRLSTVITVHPLGGCPLGATAAEGVVDPRNGEVHNYPRLHVVDGSVLPGPAGPNPSLTIAALADRFADAIIAKDCR
jgi:cholesterol oxidase